MGALFFAGILGGEEAPGRADGHLSPWYLLEVCRVMVVFRRGHLNDRAVERAPRLLTRENDDDLSITGLRRTGPWRHLMDIALQFFGDRRAHFKCPS